MTPILWLGLAALFLALEAFGIPGIGFLFAGLGALLTWGMLQLGVISQADLVWQVAAFFINSSFLALLLWKPLKRWRTTRSDIPYSNMVGDEATVIGTLTEAGGNVRWSGTTMRAKLHGGDTLSEGAAVIITAVEGNILTVRAK